MRRLPIVLASVAALALGACGSPPAAPPTVATRAPTPLVQSSPAGSGTQYLRVPLHGQGGTPHTMIGIDGVCCFAFTVDSGAADVAVSADIFRAMYKGGHITDDSLIDVKRYQTANGVIEGLRFRMPPMQIGGHTVYGVIGSVSKGSSNMLLGQSFLRKFRFWAIDNATGTLVLG